MMVDESLETKIKNAEARNSELALKNETMVATVKRLEEQVKEMGTMSLEIEELRKLHDHALARATQAEQRTLEAESRCEEMQNDLYRFHDVVRSAMPPFAPMKEALESVSAMSIAEAERLAASCSSLDADLKRRNIQCESVQGRLSSAQQSLGQIESELEHLSLIAEAPEEEIAQAHEQLDRTRELVEAYKQADSRAKQGRNRLSTRINELETGIREANELAGRAREFLEALENVETSLSGLLEQGPIKVDDNSRGADIDQDDISNIKIRLAE